MKGQTIALVLLSLLLGALGYGGGLFAAIQLGLSLHNNYEYYTEGAVGLGMAIGGAVIGLVAPWVIRRIIRG